MTDFDSHQVRLLPVEIVVYPERTVTRLVFGKKTLEEEYRQPSVSKKRRKKLKAERKSKFR